MVLPMIGNLRIREVVRVEDSEQGQQHQRVVAEAERDRRSDVSRQ